MLDILIILIKDYMNIIKGRALNQLEEECGKFNIQLKNIQQKEAISREYYIKKNKKFRNQIKKNLNE